MPTRKKQGLSINQRGSLAAFSKTGTVTLAAIAAKCDRTRHYAWLKNEAYSEAFKTAQAAAAECLENEARRRAVQGIEEHIYHRGEIVGTRHKYSDLLLIFLLKGALPAKYRDRHEVTLEPPMKVTDPGREQLTDADLERLIVAARQLSITE